MNAGPFDRLARSPAFAHGFQIRAVRPYLRMAIHAGLSRRNPRESFSFDRRMAIAAVYAVISGVVLMAKLHGLLARVIGISIVWGPVEFCEDEKQKRDDNDR